MAAVVVIIHIVIHRYLFTMISYLKYDSKHKVLEYKASNTFGEPLKIKLEDNLLADMFFEFCKDFDKAHLDLVSSLRTSEGKSY